jgi:hypothetical protein
VGVWSAILTFVDPYEWGSWYLLPYWSAGKHHRSSKPPWVIEKCPRASAIAPRNQALFTNKEAARTRLYKPVQSALRILLEVVGSPNETQGRARIGHQARTFWLAAASFSSFTVFFLVWMAVRIGGPHLTNDFDDIGELIAALVGGVTCLVAASREP